MTVIYSDFGDIDTKVLSFIWKDLDAKVIKVGYNDGPLYKDTIINAIDNETDTIVFCGHGSPSGLWSPNQSLNYSFDRSMIKYLKAKNVIGIWCNASDFSRIYNVKGFFSSMFISNTDEARINGIISVDQSSITETEVTFCQRVNALLKAKVPLNEWIDELDRQLEEQSIITDVDRFNYDGLFYNE